MVRLRLGCTGWGRRVRRRLVPRFLDRLRKIKVLHASARLALPRQEGDGVTRRLAAPKTLSRHGQPNVQRCKLRGHLR